MSEKRGGQNESDVTRPRKTRAAWLRLDCLKSNPDRTNQSRSYAGYRSAVALDGISRLPTKDLSTGYRIINPGVGMSGQPNPHYSATSVNFRMAYGVRTLWLRSHHSSPRTGKPSTRWALVQRQNTKSPEVKTVQAPTSAGMGSPIQGTAYLEGKALQGTLEMNGLSPFTPTRRRVAGDLRRIKTWRYA